MPVLALVLVAPALDLVAALQHLPLVTLAAAPLAALAAMALLVRLAGPTPSVWVALAAATCAASAALRVGGSEAAPLAALLGVLALGAGGGFGAAAEAQLLSVAGEREPLPPPVTTSQQAEPARGARRAA